MPIGDEPRFQSPSLNSSTALRLRCCSSTEPSAPLKSVPISRAWLSAFVAPRSGGAENAPTSTSEPASLRGVQNARLFCESIQAPRATMLLVLTTSRVCMLPEASVRIATCGGSVRCISRTNSGRSSVNVSIATATNRSASSRATLPRRPLRCQLLQPSHADSATTPIPARMTIDESANDQ